MTPAVDFFDTSTRNWRARLAISVDVMRELSRYTDPEEMYLVFTWRMGQVFPTARQLTVSRRSLKSPEYRVTRFNQWVEGANPWKDPHRFPVHSGGLLADLVYADEPRVIDGAVRHGDVVDRHFDYGRRAGSLWGGADDSEPAGLDGLDRAEHRLRHAAHRLHRALAPGVPRAAPPDLEFGPGRGI